MDVSGSGPSGGAAPRRRKKAMAAAMISASGATATISLIKAVISGTGAVSSSSGAPKPRSRTSEARAASGTSRTADRISGQGAGQPRRRKPCTPARKNVAKARKWVNHRPNSASSGKFAVSPGSSTRAKTAQKAEATTTCPAIDLEKTNGALCMWRNLSGRPRTVDKQPFAKNALPPAQGARRPRIASVRRGARFLSVAQTP